MHITSFNLPNSPVRWVLMLSPPLTDEEPEAQTGATPKATQVGGGTARLCALNMPANLENSAVATGLEKVTFHSNPKDRQCQNCSNYHTIAVISHASKVMLKIL